MFSFLRRAYRPFSGIGQKISNFFNIGKKYNVISDIRNAERFEDLGNRG